MIATPVVGALLGLIAGCGLLLVVLASTGTPRGGRPRPPGGDRGLGGLLRRAGLATVAPAGVIGACLVSALVAGAITLVVTAVPVAALIAAVIASNLPILLLRRRASRRQRLLRDCWPEAVDGLASGVRAGLSLPAAVGDLARHGPEPLRAAFAEFAVEYRATGSFAASLNLLQDRLADPVADRVVAALRIAREVGGSDLGVVLRSLSVMLRADGRTRGEIEARQSWTVAAARMAVAAPWLTLALLCTRPEAVRAFGTTAGAVVLMVAAGLSFVAYRLMLRIGRLPTERRMTASVTPTSPPGAWT
jgi:tight adherence protein B